MKQRHKFESIVAETLLIPLYYRAKESRRKNPILNDKVAEGLVDSLEYDYSRFDGEVERGRLRRARVVFRPCRAPLHREARRCGGGECGLWSGHPFPAYRRREGRILRHGPAGSHRAAPRADSGAAGQPLHCGLPAGCRLAGRPASPASRCAFHLRGRRRADVFL